MGAYNKFAFGSYFGPYHLWPVAGLELSETSFMTLLGLHLDQNQGFLLQNPINFIGLMGIGLLYLRDPFMAVGVSLVFFSLIVPNGLHPVWYGGWSISGRFGWSAAIVFMMPTMYALLLAHKEQALFTGLFFKSHPKHISFAIRYSRRKYIQQGSKCWSDAYPIFITPYTHGSMLYDIRWAVAHIPNYTWSAFARHGDHRICLGEGGPESVQ